MKIDVMGVRFDNVTMTEALEKAKEMLQSEGADYVVTPNSEIVYESMASKELEDLLNGASLVLHVALEDGSVLFTGDLRHPTVDFPQVVYEEEIDLVIVESAHFSSDHTEKVLENAKVKRVLHNHISPAWDEDLARMAKHPHHYSYGKAYDGMEVVL